MCKNCRTCVYLFRARKDLDDLCARCFEYSFPGDIRVRPVQTELKFNALLKADDLGEFIYNTAILTGCACVWLCGVDSYMVINNTMIAIEVDERQHKVYKKADKLAWYNDLMMVTGMNMVFLRINPDIYPHLQNKFRTKNASYPQGIEKGNQFCSNRLF